MRVSLSFGLFASASAQRSLLSARPYSVDHDHSTFRDSEGRQRFWHGTNYVNKGAPYYPTIPDGDIEALHAMGAHVVRLGVMMPGMYPDGPTLNTTYLDKIQEVVDRLFDNGIETILDLHQDVLAPKICGEGTPDWMLDVDSLHAMRLPRPAGLHPLDINSTTGHPESCSPVGPLSFIGWSMWYMTDQCGKSFQKLYDGEGAMAESFGQYWKDVATRFKDHPGVMAYELLNEPWLGDHVHDPLLLLEGGRAEREVGKYMQRMHDIVKAADPNGMVLYAPAEVNNRAMRHVGYDAGFLPEAAMSYHVYCIVGTDGDGPTNPILKELCHFNDGFQMKHREQDLRRLQTAGFVTEFGAVYPSETGYAEVEFVLNHFDAMQPPTSWAFWDQGLIMRQNETNRNAYLKLLARAYPRAVSGVLHSIHWESSIAAFEMQYTPASGNTTVFLPKKFHYPNGYDVVVSPDGAVDVIDDADGILLASASMASKVTISVSARTAALV